MSARNTSFSVRVLTAAAVLAAIVPSVWAEVIDAPSGPSTARLIERLGDDDFAVREQAQQELARQGAAAFDALSAASDHPDLEVASRVRYLLRRLRSQCASERDAARVREILREYDLYSVEARSEKIRQLAWLSDLSGVPALCRLLRFEKSPLLSAYVAAALLNREPLDAASHERWRRLIRENLADTKRPGAVWLLTCIQVQEGDRRALERWSQLIGEEEARLRLSSEESNAAVVVPLLYHLARAYKRHGDSMQAERAAERARELLASSDENRMDIRLEAAASLQRQGCFAWAEREYREATKSGTLAAVYYGGRGLAELHHDRGEYQKAAETLRQTIDSLGRLAKADSQSTEVVEEIAPSLKARMLYFLACDGESKGNVAEQVRCLEKALAADPTDSDVLIACHRRRNHSAALAHKTRLAIARETESIRERIAMHPESDGSYNQFAWLVGNTGGDLDEALRCAEKALEISPNTAAYLDTLAHVCFAKGDVQGAIKHQAKAVELEPHSGLIGRKLAEFRQAAR